MLHIFAATSVLAQITCGDVAGLYQNSACCEAASETSIPCSVPETLKVCLNINAQGDASRITQANKFLDQFRLSLPYEQPVEMIRVCSDVVIDFNGVQGVFSDHLKVHPKEIIEHLGCDVMHMELRQRLLMVAETGSLADVTIPYYSIPELRSSTDINLVGIDRVPFAIPLYGYTWAWTTAAPKLPRAMEDMDTSHHILEVAADVGDWLFGGYFEFFNLLTVGYTKHMKMLSGELAYDNATFHAVADLVSNGRIAAVPFSDFCNNLKNGTVHGAYLPYEWLINNDCLSESTTMARYPTLGTAVAEDDSGVIFVTDALAVRNNTKNKRAAFDFLSYQSTPYGQGVLPQIAGVNPAPFSTTSIRSEVAKIQYDFYGAELAAGRTSPYIDRIVTADNVGKIETAMKGVLMSTMTPAEAIAHINS